MEQTRMLIAIALSFLVLVIWQMIFVKKKPVQKKEHAVEQETVVKEASELKDPFSQEMDRAIESKVSTANGRTARELSVENSLFIARLTEKGGALKSIKLKDYRETIEKDSPMKEVLDPENEAGTLLCGFVKNSLPGLSTEVYTAGVEKDRLHIQGNKTEIPFYWKNENGVVLEKRFVFSPDSYRIDILVSIFNGSDIPIQDHFTVSLINAIPEKTQRIGHTGPSAMIGREVREIDLKDLSDQNTYKGNINWLAFQTRYFMSALMPEPSTDATIHFLNASKKHLESQLGLAESIIRPRSKQTFEFQSYFGPKNIGILKSIGKDLDQVVDFGWFSFLARPCLWLMNLMYKVVPNYGVAIIFLTLLMKIILWPLGNKSYKSMGQMKKMQPLMAEIRERYKNDKQRMNQEMMSLYKTYKVNPLGGCLPMILQIPIFFALYRMLYEAIELRHAPFFGWITDLSAPDRLFHFGFKIPMMEPPYGIPVLTIIMGASMFLQQKMQPPMGDAAQAKMMLFFMPIFMTVIFINFSSGLVLYWLVSNILGILQQYYVTKKTA